MIYFKVFIVNIYLTQFHKLSLFDFSKFIRPEYIKNNSAAFTFDLTLSNETKTLDQMLQKKFNTRLGQDPNINSDLKKLMNLIDFKSTPQQIEKIFGENYAVLRKTQDILQEKVVNQIILDLESSELAGDPLVKKYPTFLEDVKDVMRISLNFMKSIGNNYKTYTVLKQYE